MSCHTHTHTHTHAHTHTVHPSHPVASMSTPPLHPSRHLNSSLTASPFDPSFLHTLGQQVSPTEKEDLLSDSLGMLSTVAIYHSELSSSMGTPIQNKLADIRITSSYGELVTLCTCVLHPYVANFFVLSQPLTVYYLYMCIPYGLFVSLVCSTHVCVDKASTACLPL